MSEALHDGAPGLDHILRQVVLHKDRHIVCHELRGHNLNLLLLVGTSLVI